MKINLENFTAKKWLKLSFVVIFLLTVSGTGQATNELKQEIEIASRLEKNTADIGKSTQILDSWLLEAEKPTFLDEALWDVEGIHVKRLSGPEGTLSIYSRGMRSTDSILLFGGIKFRDPSDTQGSSNPILQDIMLTTYDNIEMVKGASGSVGGSTVQGAMLNIQRPYSEKRRISFSEEVGSLRRFKETITVADSFYRFDAIRLDTDRYENTTFSGSFKLGNDKISVESFIYHIDSFAQLHDAPFIMTGLVVGDAANYMDKRESDIWLYGVKSEAVITDDLSLHNTISFTDSQRRFSFGSFDGDGNFLGEDFVLDTYATLKHSENFISAVGLKHQSETFEINQRGVLDNREASQVSNDVYFEEKIQAWQVPVLLSARYNNQHASKSLWTYDASATYPLYNWSFGTHFGTGFRNPSLYERYGAILTGFGIFDLGNQNLSSERSWTWDGTVKYTDSSNTLGITPFVSQITNPVVFSTVYVNSDTARKAHGFEAFYERYLFNSVSYRANYTYTSGELLVDIPMHELGQSVIYQNGPIKANVRAAYQSQKEYAIFNLDTFTSDLVTEKSGFLLGATVSYDVNKNTQIYGKIDNLLDRKYTNGGYDRHGLEAYAGVKITV